MKILAGERCEMSGLLTSFKNQKEKENKRKSIYVASRPHCHGLTGSLTKLGGSLMLCLMLTDLQLICGALEPEARRVVPPAPCSPHALPCLHQPALPTRGRHDRQIEVACQSQAETRTCHKFPEKASSQEISRHFSQALQKKLSGGFS